MDNCFNPDYYKKYKITDPSVIEELTALINQINGKIDLIREELNNINLKDTEQDEKIDDLNSADENLNIEVNEINAELNQKNNSRHITQYTENITPLITKFFVDGVNGNDNNDGKTQSTAFKTIDKALSELNNGTVSINIKICSDGVYTSSMFNNLANCSVHIYGLTSNVTLKIQPDFNAGGLIWYQCRLHFENILLQSTLPIACDSCNWFNTNNVILDFPDIRINGGEFQDDGTLTLRGKYFQFNNGATGLFQNVIVENTDPDTRAIFNIINNAIVTFRGNFIVSALSSQQQADNGFIYVNTAQLNLRRSTIENLTLNNYNRFLTIVDSTLFADLVQYNNIISQNSYFRCCLYVNQDGTEVVNS